MNEYNNSYYDFKSIEDGTHKYNDFCNSLNNFNQNDSSTIDKTIFDAINFKMTCDQMQAQQGQAFRFAGAMVFLARLYGVKL